MPQTFTIKPATPEDVPVILNFIRELADYEKLAHEVIATEEILTKNFFGTNPHARVVIGYYAQQPVAFALFFYNFSTFLGKPGIYLEDLYVQPTMRGKGFGKKLLIYLAKITKEENCGRLEWSVLKWNQPTIDFYKSIGAKPMDEWDTYRLSGNDLQNLALQQL